MGPACIRGNTASLLPVNVFQLALKFFCSVILGQLESVRNYRGFSIIFPKNFSCNLKFYESENFPDSSLHHIFGSENLRFPFSDRFLAILRKRVGILGGWSAAAMKGSVYLSR